MAETGLEIRRRTTAHDVERFAEAKKRMKQAERPPAKGRRRQTRKRTGRQKK